MEKTIRLQTAPEIKRINPQLFSLWVAMASIIMFFGAFTSAYIVKQAAGNWFDFSVPNVMYVSAGVMIASGIFLHYAYKSFLSENERAYKFSLISSTILGIAFIVLQYIGWMELFNSGIDFKMNVSGAFFYLITGMHAAHVLGGIAALIVAVIHAFSLKFQVNDIRKNRFRMTLHYWHFVDILWIYLLIFLNVIK